MRPVPAAAVASEARNSALASGSKRGHGLVEEQYVGRLGDRQRQSDLGVLAARERRYGPVEGHPKGDEPFPVRRRRPNAG